MGARGGWLPSDPQEPADLVRGRGSGSDSHWTRTERLQLVSGDTVRIPRD